MNDLQNKPEEVLQGETLTFKLELAGTVEVRESCESEYLLKSMCA